MERRQNEGSNIHESRESGSGHNSASERGADGAEPGCAFGKRFAKIVVYDIIYNEVNSKI